MPSVNNHEVIGNLGQDAEVRYQQNGNPMVTFSVATQEWAPGGNETEWFNIAVFGKLAETMINLIESNNALGKGDLVRVTGPVRLNKYQKSDGTFDANMRIAAREVTLLGSRNSAPQGGQQGGQQVGQAPQQYQQPQGAQVPQQQPVMAPPPQGYNNYGQS